jgi:hypothetical protein
MMFRAEARRDARPPVARPPPPVSSARSDVAIAVFLVFGRF